MFPGTKVKKVNTLNRDGKKRRMGRTEGYQSKIKKAVVQLTEDSKEIEIFGGL
jgi:large subunit ribosomal protein L23